MCLLALGLADLGVIQTERPVRDRPIDSIWVRHPRFSLHPLDIEDEVIVFHKDDTYSYYRGESAQHGSFRMDLIDGKGTLTLANRTGLVARINEDTFRVTWDGTSGAKSTGVEGAPDEPAVFIYHLATAVSPEEFVRLRTERLVGDQTWISRQSHLGHHFVVLPEVGAKPATIRVDTWEALVQIVGLRDETPFALECDQADRSSFRQRLMEDGQFRSRAPRSFLTSSEDGSVVACEIGDGRIRVWDLSQGVCLLTMRSGQLFDMALTADGRFLLLRGNSQEAIVDLHGARVLATLEGSGGEVVLSADGKFVAQATGGQTCQISVWDTQTWEQRGSWIDEARGIEAFSLARDGSLLAIADDRESIRVWETATGRLVDAMEVDDEVLRLQFRSLESVLIVEQHSDLAARDLSSQQFLYNRGFQGNHTLSPDGDRYVTQANLFDSLPRGTLSWRTRAFDLLTDEFIDSHTFLAEDLSAYQFLHGNRWMVGPNFGDSLRLFDTANGGSITLQLPKGRRAESILPVQSNSVLTRSIDGAGNSSLELWNVRDVFASFPVLTPTKSIAETSKPAIGRVTAIEVSPDGSRAAVVYGESLQYRIRTIDIKSGRQLEQVKVRASSVVFLDKDIFCLGNEPNPVLDARTLRPRVRSKLLPPSGFWVSKAYRTPDASKLVQVVRSLNSHDAKIVVREARSGRVHTEWELDDAFNGTLTGLVPDNDHFIASQSDGSIRFWSLEDGHETEGAILYDNFSHWGSLALSADGRSLATCLGGRPGAVTFVYDLKTRRQQQTIDPGHPNGFSLVRQVPGTNIIGLAGWDGTIRLWDSRTDQLVAVCVGHDVTLRSTSEIPRGVTALSFSDDGKTMVSGDGMGSVLIWDLSQLDS